MHILSLENLGFWGLEWVFKLIPGKDRDQHCAFIIEVNDIIELKTTQKFVSLSCEAGAV